MVKVIAYSVVALLLVASAASAQVGSLNGSQNWTNALGSTVTLTGAPGTGGSLGVILNAAGQSQTTTAPTSASQGFGLIGVQGAFAQNNGSANISVGQTLGITGATAGLMGPGQVQAVAADSGLVMGGAQQFEGITLTGGQNIIKNGDGTAIGLNAGGALLGQEVSNASTTGTQGILIVGGQLSGATGDAGSGATIVTTMTSTVLQYQSANIAAP